MTTGEGGAVSLNGGAGNTGNEGNNQGDTGNNSTGDNQGGTNDVFAGLSPENRAFAESKGMTADNFDINKMFGMHVNADKMISQGAHKQSDTGNKPGDGSGVPANPAGYEFKIPEGLPEGLPYDKGFAENFANWAHNNGMDKAQAQGLHDFYVEQVSGQFSSSQQTTSQAFNEKVAGTFEALTKEWGGTDTPGFQRNLELSRRAMSNLHPDFKQGLIDAGVIKVNGTEEIVTNSSIMLGLQKVGASMFAEDSEWGGKPSTDNPFDPKTQDLAAQGDLIRENRELAKQLIRAAGQEEHWQHVLNK